MSISRPPLFSTCSDRGCSHLARTTQLSDPGFAKPVDPPPPAPTPSVSQAEIDKIKKEYEEKQKAKGKGKEKENAKDEKAPPAPIPVPSPPAAPAPTGPKKYTLHRDIFAMRTDLQVRPLLQYPPVAFGMVDQCHVVDGYRERSIRPVRQRNEPVGYQSFRSAFQHYPARRRRHDPRSSRSSSRLHSVVQAVSFERCMYASQSLSFENVNGRRVWSLAADVKPVRPSPVRSASSSSFFPMPIFERPWVSSRSQTTKAFQSLACDNCRTSFGSRQPTPLDFGRSRSPERT